MKRSLLLASMLCCVVGAGTLAHAQPDPNNAPKGANPPVMAPGMDMGAWQKMTPAQRQEVLSKIVEQTLRTTMAAVGYDDKGVQDAVVVAALAREKSLTDVRDRQRTVTQALMAKQTDAQMDIALDNLRMAEEDAADARVKQLADLDKKVDYSNKPRLKAFLSIVGIIGDDSAAIGGVLGSTMMAMNNVRMGVDTPAADKPAPQAVPAAPVAPVAPVADAPVAVG